MSSTSQISHNSDEVPVLSESNGLSTAEMRWLVAANELTDFLLSAPPSVDPYVITVDHARRAARAVQVVTVVGAETKSLHIALYDSGSTAVR